MKPDSAFPRLWLGFLTVMLCCSGCSTVSGTMSQPDFSLSASVASISLTAGGPAQAVAISAMSVHGFSGAISMTVTGIPAGVSVSEPNFTIKAGSSQTVQFTAASSAASASATVQFQGVAGGSNHTISSPIIISPVVKRSGTDVVTYHFDNLRTGLNPHEY